jgi:uncharacterized protein YyaL (SSP411 family)
MNRLSGETSPYLLQHAHNPVDWRPWGPEALDEAKRSDKPILLSVGYAACHWCHVMAHESFENESIAALMNELFVNIKVDREERPDLDTIYQHALAMLGEQGGWPLTMFLTPAGEPFWGGTYFPPEPRFGRPAFAEVLRGIAGVYRTQREKVSKNVEAIHGALGKMWESHPGDGISISVNDQAARRLVQEVDRVHGGIGAAPKFPNTSVLELIWRGGKRLHERDMLDAVTLTLDRMCQGGIYDHLGGGFARYSTDAQWLVPHFEKMLYDNAQIIDLLLLTWQETRKPLYEQRIRETAEWLLREMVADGGGFAATLDADSEGVEGKFYVWSEAEVDAVLGADAPSFKAAYDVSAHGNWEETNILHRTDAAADESALAAARIKLLSARAKRIRPGWDDKVLADWNGLMIAALARAGRVFGEESWIDAATIAFDFVVTRMIRNGRLSHSYRNGSARHAATLDDYAAMMLGAVALAEVTGEPRFMDRAKEWLAVVEAHFRDANGGGYFFTADDAEALIVRTKTANDNATPAGNGMLVQALARLYYLTGDDAYRARAEAVIAAFAGEVERNFFPLCTLLNGAELLAKAVQIVLVGDGKDGLADAAWRASAPNKVIQRVAPGAFLPASHPAYAKASAGRPAAYVCVGTTCSLPLTDPTALEAQLRS